jgi:hypothetical protein
MYGFFEDGEQFSFQRTLIDLRPDFQLHHDFVGDVLDYQFDWHFGSPKIASNRAVTDSAIG